MEPNERSESTPAIYTSYAIRTNVCDMCLVWYTRTKTMRMLKRKKKIKRHELYAKSFPSQSRAKTVISLDASTELHQQIFGCREQTQNAHEFACLLALFTCCSQFSHHQIRMSFSRFHAALSRNQVIMSDWIDTSTVAAPKNATSEFIE